LFNREVLHVSVAQQSDPVQQMIQMLAGFWVGKSLQVAASVRVADHVGDESSHAVEDLAAATGTHAPSLYRLMRALAASGVFVEASPGRFRHTPLSRMLRSDHPTTLRAFFESVLGGGHYTAWGALEHSVRTGETAFDHAHGMDVWAHFAAHPNEGRTFDRAMTDMSVLFNPAIVAGYDYSAVRTLVDVGGGHGALLASILKANPAARGVLFDQPHVIDGARQRFADEGLAQRAQTAAGSFFESVPAGGDAYLMKFILHDWDDARSTQILRNVHRAAGAGARLLVVDTVVPAGNEPSFSKLMDLNMLAMTGGRERTEAEFAALFEGAGFELVKVHPTECPLSIVEGARR
jgi:hypothetical protein